MHPDWKAVLAPNCHKAIAHLQSVCNNLAIWDGIPQKDVQQLNQVCPHNVLPEYNINLKMQMCKVQCNVNLNMSYMFVAEKLGP